MNLKILDTFRLLKEKEEFSVVRSTIDQDAVFTGTNLWILFFAILVASLGLNMNSTAVIIGAMLISPLMGPIVGLGFGVAVNDLPLFRKAFRNYTFAAGVGLAASTIYFLISPIDEAHSEILSRTLPTIYDVLIAFFGGFAGIIALASKHKGNVIPGVAIATALMPPLCTAGYGLATWQLNYFLGAFYLYLINSVFIAAATLITTYLLRFPVKKYADPTAERKERLIIWSVILVTLLPSLYLGYDLVGQYKFRTRAEKFVDTEAKFPNDYLLSKQIDTKKRRITLTFGGKQITDQEIEDLKAKLKYYGLENVPLEIKQGFTFLKDTKTEERVNQLLLALKQNEQERMMMRADLDSLNDQQWISHQVFRELKVQYPQIKTAILQSATINQDSSASGNDTYLVLLTLSEKLKKDDPEKIEKWLRVRLNREDVSLVIRDKN